MIGFAANVTFELVTNKTNTRLHKINAQRALLQHAIDLCACVTFGSIGLYWPWQSATDLGSFLN